MPVAADVPGIYDLIINGEGYILANQIDPNIPFKTQRARYGITPTFITRQNVSGNFGDNQQDFWLTASQNDWSLGEQQRYFKQDDDTSRRRYWLGTNINTVWVPGQATIRPAVTTKTFASAVSVCGPQPQGGLFAYGATHQHDVSSGVVSDDGVDGLGLAPSRNAVVTDGGSTFFTSSGAALIRKTTSTTTWTTFNATTGAIALCFLNNTLCGIQGGILSKFDTAGTASTVFQWKQADGGALGISPVDITPFGGKVAVLIRIGAKYSVWEADTSANTAQIVAEFPPDFIGTQLCQVNGVLFIAGISKGQTDSRQSFAPTIYYFANGSSGKLWQSKFQSIGTDCAMIPYGDGMVFSDDSQGTINYYQMATGGISTIFSYTVGASRTDMVSDENGAILITNGSTTGYYLSPSAAVASSATLVTSLFDFGSSLDKYVRGIKLDFDLGTDGNGGSVDIAYQLNSQDGGFTTLQTGATAGIEYQLTSQCRSIAVRITLNKGTSTFGPILKRIYVRAAPIQQSFRNDDFILDCTGAKGKTPVQLRNGNSHSKTGRTMVTNLRAIVSAATPISVTDRFGTYTAVIDASTFDCVEVNPDEYFVRFNMREV